MPKSKIKSERQMRYKLTQVRKQRGDLEQVISMQEAAMSDRQANKHRLLFAAERMLVWCLGMG